MFTARRAGIALSLIAVVLLLPTLLGDPGRWVDGRLSTLLDFTNVEWLANREPPAEVSPEHLSTYTRTVAGEQWFQDNFVRMAFGDEEGPDSYTGRITKWDKRRVRVSILKDPGPEESAFVRYLVSRLNTIQEATTFKMVEGSADVTFRFVSHEDYVRAVPRESVGHCEVSYYLGRSGLISATITIDAEALATPDKRKPVIVHEFTHAIGFRGHLHDPRERRESVLYYTPMLSDWTQNDRAAIRILYSSSMRSGSGVSGVRGALDRIAATGKD